MEMVLQILILVLGFVCLVKGSDWFVDGAAGIATKFGIPQLIIGLTIVAMGTSAPEAAVSITAAFNGSADITIGNIVEDLETDLSECKYDIKKTGVNVNDEIDYNVSFCSSKKNRKFYSIIDTNFLDSVHK